MKKQQKKPDSDSITPQPIMPVVGEKAFKSPGNSDNELDADELVHQNRDEEPNEAAFDEDEAAHKVKRNTNIEPARNTDIDDLIHENEGEDEEPTH